MGRGFNLPPPLPIKYKIKSSEVGYYEARFNILALPIRIYGSFII